MLIMTDRMSHPFPIKTLQNYGNSFTSVYDLIRVIIESKIYHVLRTTECSCTALAAYLSQLALPQKATSAVVL